MRGQPGFSYKPGSTGRRDFECLILRSFIFYGKSFKFIFLRFFLPIMIFLEYIPIEMRFYQRLLQNFRKEIRVKEDQHFRGLSHLATEIMEVVWKQKLPQTKKSKKHAGIRNCSFDSYF